MSKIYIASDHAGFALKAALILYIGTIGHEVEDLGAHAITPDDDYPDYMLPCAEKVAAENLAQAGPSSTFGVIIGGSGQGEAMAANRVFGARAAVFYGPRQAIMPLHLKGELPYGSPDAGPAQDGFDIVRLEREHNDANILSIGARFVSGTEAADALHLFLTTPFSNDERHIRRIAKY